jgi:hypothetical protein
MTEGTALFMAMLFIFGYLGWRILATIKDALGP